MATAATSSRVPTICFSSSLDRQKHSMGSAKFAVAIPNYFSTTRMKRSLPVRASDPEGEDVNSSVNTTSGSFTSQEDLSYLWKLGAGSIAGAAVIKYGSILFPEITRPNILQALIMISAPVVVAVVLLIKQSRVE
ncbi:hypothetical protein L1049_004859 [Liquidambar formosana]|uniref:Uncharacterized protein n=1 Tax=Liquidambar formosana TaxID=63359 RepID=A0AAP0X0R2_LIQFO